MREDRLIVVCRDAIVGAAASRPRSTGFRIGMHPGEFIQRFDLNVGEALSLPLL